MIKQKHLSLAMTLKCNLKCKLCSASSPYYYKPTVYTAEVLNESIDMYFKIVSNVEKFTFTGGEPLLNTALADVIEHSSIYFNRMGVIEIITNGTILPSHKLIETLIKYPEINVLIDNYGEDVSCKAVNIKSLLEANKITCKERIYFGENMHYGGWVDFRTLERHDKNPEIIFLKCAYPQKMGFCFTMLGGKIFPCSATRRCVELGIIPIQRAEYIDILDSNLSIEQKQNQFEVFNNLKYLLACEYCLGLSDERKRFNPGEQGHNLEKIKYRW